MAGLSQQDVEAGVEDENGLLWFTTYDGLNRFDGYNFKIFRHEPDSPYSLPNNRLTALTNGSNNRLWIGSENGQVILYRKDVEQFKVIAKSSIQNGNIVIRKIVEYNDTTIFVADGRLNKLELYNDHYKYIDITPSELENNLVTTLTLEKNGILWIGTDKTVYRGILNTAGELVISHRWPNNMLIHKIVIDNDEKKWICGDTGLYYLEANITQKSILNKVNMPYMPLDVHNILKIGDFKYLIYDSRALIYYNFATSQIEKHESDFFDSNILKDFFVDRTHNVWLLSGNKGIAKLNLVPDKFYNIEFKTKNGFVKYIHTSSRGLLLIGTKEDGIWIQNQAGQSQYTHLLGTRFISDITEDNKGDYWVCSDYGLYIINQQNFKIKEIEDIANINRISKSKIKKKALAIAKDKKGDMWVAFKEGLLQVPNSFSLGSCPEFHSFAESPLSDNIEITRMLYDAKNDGFWIATNGAGLLFFSKKQSKHIRDNPNRWSTKNVFTHNKLAQYLQENSDLNSNHVWALAINKEGDLFVGTDVGINKVTRNKQRIIITKVGKNTKLKQDKIMAIQFDNIGCIWLNTGRGLVFYNPVNDKCITYLESDGLRSNILSEASAKSPTGEIYIGSILGINSFIPEKIVKNPSAPKIIFSSLVINHRTIEVGDSVEGQVLLKKSLLYTDRIELPYNFNNIKLEVIPLHYSNAGQNKIAYRLDGIDKEWVYTSNHLINYINLPVGTYTLFVKAANADDIWMEAPCSLLISISPPPWATPWAYTAYIIILFGLFFILVYSYERKRKRRVLLLLEKMTQTREVELNKSKLQFHTNIMHEIRTPLSLIISPLSELIDYDCKDAFINKKISLIARNAHFLNNTLNQFLDLRKVENDSYFLHLELGCLREIVIQVMNLFYGIADQKKIIFRLIDELEESEFLFDKNVVSRILVNLLSNAFKFTPDRGTINIFLHQSENKVLIKVEDSGYGIPKDDLENIFERYFQLSSNENSTGSSGIGLSLTQQFARLHKGKITVESSISVGSSFTVELPFNDTVYSQKELSHSETFDERIELTVEIPTQNEYNIDNNHNSSAISNTLPILLINEDNLELANYLIEAFSSSFCVYHALNGTCGMELALTYVPDIVITDLMMDNGNGTNFIMNLKKDNRINHIPVLILTARAMNDDILSGLQIGAIDFVTKPFNISILKAKVQNILLLVASRAAMNQSTDPLVNNFLDELRKFIYAEMTHPDFSIDYICKSLSISRMQLHRKMISITSESSSNFIRNVRLGKAKELIEHEGYNVSEAMYAVGFSNLSSFTQVFKKYFGMSPSSLIKIKTSTPKHSPNQSLL